MPCASGIAAYSEAGPAWFEPAHAHPTDARLLRQLGGDRGGAAHHEVAHPVVAIDQRGGGGGAVDRDVGRPVDGPALDTADVLRQAEDAVGIGPHQDPLPPSARRQQRRPSPATRRRPGRGARTRPVPRPGRCVSWRQQTVGGVFGSDGAGLPGGGQRARGGDGGIGPEDAQRVGGGGVAGSSAAARAGSRSYRRARRGARRRRRRRSRRHPARSRSPRSRGSAPGSRHRVRSR